MSKTTLEVGPIEKINDEREVIRATAAGLFGADEIKTLVAWGQELNRKAQEHSRPPYRPVGILLNIQGLEGYNSPEVLSVLANLMKSDKPYVYRTATYGGTKMHELVQQVLESMADRQNLRNFQTEAEAIAWLAE